VPNAKRTSSPLPSRGRPRRIDRDAIAQAVLEIGSENATMRRVAEHLGVSLPGLYHHVTNQDELLMLVAHRTLENSPPPQYEGQHWALWLRSYASYIRTAFIAEPALLEKFLIGVTEDYGELAYIGEALDVLRAQGLEPSDALDVWVSVAEMAMGAVSEAHREYVHRQQGRPWIARIFLLIANIDQDRYATLGSVARAGCDPFTEEAFQRRVTLLLKGIEVQYDLPPEPTSGSRRSSAKR
jgi:AcrR family transcriptional regulator